MQKSKYFQYFITRPWQTAPQGSGYYTVDSAQNTNISKAPLPAAAAGTETTTTGLMQQVNILWHYHIFFKYIFFLAPKKRHVQ
jgi:hypothetical protein